MEDEFVFNDETKTNSHGFVLLNSGGNFERFNSNPAMLWSHNQEQLIGQWKNLRIEGDKLIAQAIYDEDDDLALKCKSKAKKGILKGCSPGIIINAIELRLDTTGAERMTVTDWELCEGSLVSVPSNAGALKLYAKNGQPIPDGEVKLSIQNLLSKTNKKDKTMEGLVLTVEAYTALGLASGSADGRAVSAAIMELQARVSTAEKAVDDQKREKANALVDLAIAEGRITADKKESFVKLALQDYKMAEDTINAIPKKETLGGKVVTTGVKTQTGREAWTYLKWAKEDPKGLAELKLNDPEAFADLQKKRV